MPQIGEIKKAREIGRKGSTKFIWLACPECGKERWIGTIKGEPKYHLCYACAIKQPERSEKISEFHKGKKYAWKGGRTIATAGYIYIYCQPDNFFHPMATKKNYIMEHRLVMAKHLNRCLFPWEIVHHKGIRYSGIKNKSDNLRDNLELLPTTKQHIVSTRIQGLFKQRDKKIEQLGKRVLQLEAELTLLRGELSMPDLKEAYPRAGRTICQRDK